MVVYVGDLHGKPDKICKAILENHMTKEDIIVQLGDAGFNYYIGVKDMLLKDEVNALGVTIFCIQGNHEERPYNLPVYKEKEWRGGVVYYEEQYPNLLFAKDGEIYDLGGKKAIVLGGAYSVDKFYRISRGWRWFKDEQPNAEIKKYVEDRLNACDWKVDYVLSHTCPYKYRPVEAFIKNLDQSTVDTSTEEWLDVIEGRLQYEKWFCGHWHIDKQIDKLNFLMETFILDE